MQDAVTTCGKLVGLLQSMDGHKRTMSCIVCIIGHAKIDQLLLAEVYRKDKLAFCSARANMEVPQSLSLVRMSELCGDTLCKTLACARWKT